MVHIRFHLALPLGGVYRIETKTERRAFPRPPLRSIRGSAVRGKRHFHRIRNTKLSLILFWFPTSSFRGFDPRLPHNGPSWTSLKSCGRKKQLWFRSFQLLLKYRQATISPFWAARFGPAPPPTYGTLAQSVEQSAHNGKTPGSSPRCPTSRKAKQSQRNSHF